MKKFKIIYSFTSVKLLGDHLIPIPSWNHIDFIYGKEAGHYVNSIVLDHLREFD